MKETDWNIYIEDGRLMLKIGNQKNYMTEHVASQISSRIDEKLEKLDNQ